MTRSMANGRVGSGALFVALGLFLLVSWVMTEVPAFAYVGPPIVLLGAAFIAWGVASLRRLPAAPAPPAAALKQ